RPSVGDSLFDVLLQFFEARLQDLYPALAVEAEAEAVDELLLSFIARLEVNRHPDDAAQLLAPLLRRLALNLRERVALLFGDDAVAAAEQVYGERASRHVFAQGVPERRPTERQLPVGQDDVPLLLKLALDEVSLAREVGGRLGEVDGLNFGGRARDRRRRGGVGRASERVEHLLDVVCDVVEFLPVAYVARRRHVGAELACAPALRVV